MELYRELIINLYKNPLNKRPMKDATITASGANVTCGDRFRIYAKVTRSVIPAKTGIYHSLEKRHPRAGGDLFIEDLSFEGEGCAISVASASLLTEEAKGKTLSEIKDWNILTVNSWLSVELTPSRVKCGLLALETLQQIVALSLSKGDWYQSLSSA